MIGLKSRTRHGILLLVFLASIIIIHDLRPYSEYEYETQHGSITSQVSFDTQDEYLTIITVYLYDMIIEPSYEIRVAAILSSNFDNVTLHVLLTDNPSLPHWALWIYDEYSNLSGDFNNDTSISFYNLSSDGHTLALTIYNSPSWNCTISGTISYTIEYTIDVIFRRPQKFLITQFLLQIVVLPDSRIALAVAVVLVAIFLCYISNKMMRC